MNARRWDPVWTRAPVVLLRYRRLGAAVLVAAAVLGMASAVGPLFLSSARNAALSHEIGEAPADTLGLRVSAAVPIEPTVFEEVDRAVRDIVTGHTDHLGSPVLTLHGRYIDAAASADAPGSTRVNLIHRTDALANVELVNGAGDEEEGAYLPQSLAERLGLGPGDELVLQRAGQDVGLSVAGTYEDLGPADTDGYWRPLTGLIIALRPPELGGQPPPPLVLATREAFVGALAQMDVSVPMSWSFPLAADPSRLSVAEAEELSAAYARVDRRVHTRGEVVYDTLRSHSGPTVDSALPGLVRNVVRAARSFEGSVHLLTLAARAVGLLVLAATAVFLVRARRNEVERAWASGSTASRLGARFALEAALPVVAGAALGGALTSAAVQRLGPSPRLDPGVASETTLAVAGASALGLALFALVTAISISRVADGSASGLSRAGRAPWEVLVLVLAAASFAGIATRRSVYTQGADGPQLDVLAVAFPLLFLVGVIGVAIRAIGRALPHLGTVGGSLRTELLLSVRRFAAAGGLGLVLVAATATAFGVGSFAATTAASTDRTLELKSLTAVGARTSAQVSRSAGDVLDAGDLPFPATLVRRTDADAQPGGREVEVLAVEPDSLREVLEWDDAFGASLERTMAALRSDPDEEVPVVTVGSSLPAELSLEASSFDLDARVALHLEAFPGWDGRDPLVVVGAERIDAVLEARGSTIPSHIHFVHEVWAETDEETLRSALLARSTPVARMESAAELRASPTLLGLGWTLDLFTAIGLAMVLLGSIGIVLYAQARQRETEIAYVLMKRMGLTRGAHRTALAVELVALLALSAVIGGATGICAAWLLNAPFDPLAGQPPDPRFIVPPAAAAVGAAVVATCALGGAWAVQRAADRARETEVLRLAE